MGRVFAIKGYLLPEPKNGKGKHVSAFFTLEENERVVAIKDDTMRGAKYVFFATKMGIAKRLDVRELANLTRAGRRVISLDEGNIIARVRFTSGNDELLFVSAKGKALRTKEDEFRPLGRQARGVRAMRLSRGDVLVGCEPDVYKRQLFCGPVWTRFQTRLGGMCDKRIGRLLRVAV